MLNTTQIDEAVLAVIDHWKKDRGRIVNLKKDKKLGEGVEYYEGYQTFKSWKEHIAIHAVKGVKPTELLMTKAPCQSDEEMEFNLKNYKQITLPVPQEFLNTIGRGLHSSNWSITYAEDDQLFVSAEKTLQKYLETDIAGTGLGMSYESWWRYVLPAIKVTDPMGAVGWKPYRPEKIVKDAAGNDVIAGDVLPEPIPCYYSTEQIMSPLEADYYLFDTYEKSEVEYGSRKERIGFVFELYDDQNIYRITQTGKYIEFTYTVDTYFAHGLGFIPVTRLKGTPTYFENKIVWQSPLSLVVDILDEAILDNINLRSIKASSTYPQKVMVGHVCRHEVNYNGVVHHCEGGFILSQDSKTYDKCPECKGTGLEMRTSPLNTILLKPKDPMDPSDPIKASEALSFQQPSTESAQFLRKEVIDSLNRSKEILHLKTTNSVVKGAEDMTATGMAIDEKAKNAFLSLPVDQIFEIGEFGIDCIGRMRYAAKFKKPTVQRPVTYDFNSEADYLANIAAAQDSGAQPVVIHGYLVKYLKSVYYDDLKVSRIYELMIVADRLLALSQDDINMKLSRNLVAPWEVVLHDSARNLIDNLIAKDSGFLELDIMVMKDRLIEAAKAAVPAAPVSTIRALNPETILQNANAPRAAQG